jgi:hypothetical protein
VRREGSLAFLDDDEPLEPEDLGQSRRYGADGQRPFLARRLMALVIGVLIVVLLVLGIRGCLNARAERGFENYVRDLASIATESEQLSKEFFGRLEDPGDLSPIELGAEISADRGTAENLLERVQGLDAPDELAAAQGELELGFELRRDGIAGTADEIDTALAKEGAQDATEVIANYMRYFLASDVLYGRSKGDIANELAAQDIVPDEKLSNATFLPSDEWLDPTFLDGLLSGVTVAGGAGSCKGVCGIALVDGGVSIGGTVLTADATTTVSGGGPYELEVQVQNQGESEVTDVTVEYVISGAETNEGSTTISRIAVGETGSAKLNIQPEPASGDELPLEVTAVPVEGEEIAENNTQNFTVLFE